MPFEWRKTKSHPFGKARQRQRSRFSTCIIWRINWISSCYRAASPRITRAGDTYSVLPRESHVPLRVWAAIESWAQLPQINYKWFLKCPKVEGGGGGLIAINSRAKMAYMWIVFSDYIVRRSSIHADVEQDWTIIELSARISFMPPTPACRLGIDNSIEVRVVRWTEPPLLLLQVAPFDLDTRTRARMYTYVHITISKIALFHIRHKGIPGGAIYNEMIATRSPDYF